MKKQYQALIFLGILFFLACGQTAEQKTPSRDFLPVFEKIMQAHGGFEQWNKMQSLAYTLKRGETVQQHNIDLKKRRTRIEEAGKYTLGFDGEAIWVAPNRDSFPGSSPRFMHNLHFYFFALPFVLADPGVTLSDEGEQESGGKKYRVVKATFGAGVGDAPDDQYFLYVDPQSHQIAFSVYSVTYFDASKATKYNALKFEWTKQNGLLVPTTYTGYKWEEGEFGAERFTYHFADASYKTTEAPSTLFAIPEGAEVTEE